MPGTGRPRGAILLFATLVLLACALALVATAAGLATAALRGRLTERALGEAREALIAYAADRPLTSAVGPGYLPCPDLDGDGWAEPTCGSLDGASGADERVGRLPWKTLGLAELRDGDGEPLWYAVSSKHKGLLNCAASRPCVDMSPAAALGAITVRDPSGSVVHDATLADPARAQQGGAAAVVIAPGAPLARLGPDGSRVDQRRECAPGACDSEGRCILDPPRRAARCDPANYLDRAPGAAGEDNADFVDRNDAAGRALDANGFIQGPVRLPSGEVVVNDRIVAITYRDLMPAVMRRVALEVVHCLRYYATRPENAGRYPWPAASCRETAFAGNAPDLEGAPLGGVPDTPFERSAGSSGGRMLERWWRATPRHPESRDELPTREDACGIAVAPDDAGPVRDAPAGTPADEGETASLAGNAWWGTWRPYVSYALARGFSPEGPGTPDCAAGGCIAIDEATGRNVARGAQVAVIVTASCAEAPACASASCDRVVLAPDPDHTRHAAATYP